MATHQDGGAVAAALTALRLASARRDVNAFAGLLPEPALAAAERSDARRASGSRLGRLDGVPYAVKDNVFVAGAPVTWGSRCWAGHRAERSDVCVERMDAAGAVLVGTTTMPELAVGQTTSSAAYGTTRNPVDPRLTPGGSSGGSAAAVAAGIVPVALGTDAGGSTRAPASLTGLYGLRTAAGVVPRVNGFPQLVPGFQTIGILSADLDLVVAALSAMRGPDPRDPGSLLTRRVAPWPGRLRVAVITSVERVRVDPVVLARVAAVAERLRTLGAVVREVPAPYSWSGLREAWDTMAAVGIAAALAGAPGPGPAHDGLLAAAARAADVDGADYLRALTSVAHLRAEVEERLWDHDLVLCPTTLTAAWPADGGDPVLSDGTSPDPGDLGAFTHWVNAVGWAALSVPVEPFDDGRPIGVQLVAARGGEDLLLEVAGMLASASATGDIETSGPGSRREGARG